MRKEFSMPMDDINPTISFRLPEALHNEVVRLAEASGVTKHQLARTLVVQALEEGERSLSDTDLSGFEEAFQLLQISVADFRLAFGRGVAAILQDVKPTRSKEEIRKWVFERIITPTPSTDAGGGDPR